MWELRPKEAEIQAKDAAALPVDAVAICLYPNSDAFKATTALALSFKDPEGLTVSSLAHRCFNPKASRSPGTW